MKWIFQQFLSIIVWTYWRVFNITRFFFIGGLQVLKILSTSLKMAKELERVDENSLSIQNPHSVITSMQGVSKQIQKVYCLLKKKWQFSNNQQSNLIANVMCRQCRECHQCFNNSSWSFIKILPEVQNNYNISSTDDMQHVQSVLIGSKLCLEGNNNWKHKVSWNASNVYCRLQKKNIGV